jgi:hypothetical protein
VQQPYSTLSRLITDVSRSHTDTLHSVALIWTRDRPDAETSIWQHTTFTKDRPQCPRFDLNPQSQQMSGRRTTLYVVDRAASGIGMKFVSENGNESQNFGLSTEGRRSLRRCTCRWENNIKMNYADTLCGGANWSEIHQNGIQWWPVWTP